MTLVRWDPFDDSFGVWAPPVDRFEKDQNLMIRAEIPGVDKSDLDVHVENGVLTIRGARKRDAAVDEGSAYRFERTYGTFVRSFTLPTTVDGSRIAATYKDGMLQIAVPKLEAAKSRRIDIHAA